MTKTARILIVVTLALGWAALATAPAAAQAQNEVAPATKGPHQWHPEAVKAIDQLRSPYCPALMLEVCSSSAGAALRDSLEMLAQSGMKADSIVGWVLANHGDQWLVLPPASGRGLVAWVVPPLAIVFGIVGVMVVLRRLRKPRPDGSSEAVSDEGNARLDAALRELEAEEETHF